MRAVFWLSGTPNWGCTLDYVSILSRECLENVSVYSRYESDLTLIRVR